MNREDILSMTNSEVATMVASRTRELRKKKKINRTDFARNIGMSFGSYQQFEQSGKISFDGLLGVVRGSEDCTI